MGLEMRVKRAILRELARRYQRRQKKEKTRGLEEFIGLTGYNRSYGSWLLRTCGRKLILSGGDRQRVEIIG
ncbi:MAG: transposase, partial [Candidatus Saccharicenans sp.]|nr:transposase [Candidatus Saccharicenans sp.]